MEARKKRHLSGCWCCYHKHIMSQFGGNSYGKRARGFNQTYRNRHCQKHYLMKVTAFHRCKDYIFGIFQGAGFEGYDKDKQPRHGDNK